MKKILTIFGAMLLISITHAQGFQNKDLDINNVKAKINSTGALFWNYDNATYEVPIGSGVHSIFAANLWIGGYDSGGMLHLAGETYRQNGGDFYPGPVMDSQNYSIIQDEIWNKVWKIHKSTIDSFQSGLFSSPPQSILDWPGNGDVSLGQAANLAPYFDANNNGIYDPLNGDFPVIRGDQAIFYIFNDDRHLHTETNSEKMRIEVHGMAYGFNCADAGFQHTTFFHYDFINRSNTNYENTRIATYVDYDLGCAFDDFIGCDSLLNSMYVYNGDISDATCFTQLGYGNTPPAQSTTFLNESLANFVYYNNNNTNQGNPNQAIHYYNYMNGKWKDGTHTTYGGQGYGGATETNFMYSGDPESSNGWTETSVSNLPDDRRGLASIHPFDFAPGQTKTLDIAFVFAKSNSGTNLSSVTFLKQRIQEIQNAFTLGVTACGGAFMSNPRISENNLKSNFELYPNPSLGKIYVRSDSKINSIEIYNLLGQKIYYLESRGLNPEINFSMSDNGIYFAKFNFENNSVTKKIVIH